MLEASSLFPYVAPESYLAELGEGSYVAWGYGGDLVVMLMSDMGSSVKSVNPLELKEIGLSDESAWQTCFDNLDRILNAGEIGFRVDALSSGTKAFIVDEHWAASALTLHPSFFLTAANALGSEDLRVLVPSRDSAIVVTTSSLTLERHAILDLASALRAMSRKPFSPNEFRLSATGIQDA